MTPIISPDLCPAFCNGCSNGTKTTANFQLVSEILNLFFLENNIPKSDCEEFRTESKESIKNLAYSTLYKSLNYYPLIEESFYNTLPELNIKDCRYGERYLNYLNNTNDFDELVDSLMIERQHINLDEPGISACDGMKLSKKSWLLGLQEEYDGILFRIGVHDTLLVKISALCDTIREKMDLSAHPKSNWMRC